MVCLLDPPGSAQRGSASSHGDAALHGEQAAGEAGQAPAAVSRRMGGKEAKWQADIVYYRGLYWFDMVYIMVLEADKS